MNAPNIKCVLYASKYIYIYIAQSSCYIYIHKKANTVMVLELQQANPEDVQLHLNSKKLRIMRYLITRGLCMLRTSLSLVVDIKKCLADLRGQTPLQRLHVYLHLMQNQESAILNTVIAPEGY